MATQAVEFEVKRIVRFEGNGPVRAYCDLAIGDLAVIRGVRVVDGKKGRFMSMPRQQGKNSKWYDLVSLNDALRGDAERVVLEAFERQDGAEEESLA